MRDPLGCGNSAFDSMAHQRPTETELGRLAAFRDVARRLYPLVSEHRNHRFVVRGLGDNATSRLLPVVVFESMARGVRLTYLKREPANYYRIRKIVASYGSIEVKERCENLKEAWAEAIRGMADFVDDDRRYTGENILETWFYAKGWHQYSDRQEDAQVLKSFEPHVSQILQFNVLRMAICILDLDREVAAILKEPTLDEERPEMPQTHF